MSTALPDSLAEIRDDFHALGEKDRLQLLLEFSNELPELPPEHRDRTDLFERVEECQSPVFLLVDVRDGTVHVHATAPAESPTTRGFASILVQGLSGLSAGSPLRLRGMTGMLGRIQRQVREKSAA